MERGSRKSESTQAYDIGNKQLGTVGNLLKLTKEIEIDPRMKIVFYLENERGGLDFSARKDFLSIAKVNELLEKLSPTEELPEKLFVHIPQEEI